MFKTGLVLFLLAACAVTSAGQPADADLILSFMQRDSGGRIVGGFTARFDPRNPATWTTVATAPPGDWHNGAHMASDNTDLVIRQCYQTVATRLVNVDPAGRCTTISPGLPMIEGFRLDHDDSWIACGGGTFLSYSLFSIRPGTTVVQTLWSMMIAPGQFNDVTIDRDPGGPTYAIAVWDPSGFPFPAKSPKILHADRKGVRRSFDWTGNPLLELSSITLHPRTGDYLTTDFMGPGRGETKGAEVNRVTKAGAISTLGIFSGANGASIDQHDTAWIIGYLGSTQTVVRFDMTRNAVITLIPLTNLPPLTAATGIERYGSRRLVCSQRPSSPATVNIRVQSRDPLAAGASYILAASPGRRPGMRFAHGEWLNLDTTHPLFWWTAQNLDPKMFVNFRGLLNGNGNNTQPIQVKIPSGLPKLNDMAIFVGGVIYDPKNNNQVIQITNSHWFVLP